jgi:hypothetical protein
MRPLPTGALLALCLSACIVEAPTSEKSGARARATVREVPKVSIRGGAELGGKVQMLGAEVEPGQLVPGEPARVSVFYKVLEEMDRDYLVFVHVEDVDGRMGRFNVDHPPAGGQYPTRSWRKGETVRDEFALTIPAEAGVRAVNVWLGFWHPETDSRLELRNPEVVRNDGSNRVLLAQLPVAR